jgi:hypothetical protein
MYDVKISCSVKNHPTHNLVTIPTPSSWFIPLWLCKQQIISPILWSCRITKQAQYFLHLLCLQHIKIQISNQHHLQNPPTCLHETYNGNMTGKHKAWGHKKRFYAITTSLSLVFLTFVSTHWQPSLYSSHHNSLLDIKGFNKITSTITSHQ